LRNKRLRAAVAGSFEAEACMKPFWIALFLAVCCACQPGAAAPPATTASANSAPGKTCGGFAGLACAANEACVTAPGVCVTTADATGICKPRPEVCPHIYKAVCGCDGRTYPNACTAEAAGVSVAAEGECKIRH
jgi:hypothetical protein